MPRLFVRFVGGIVLVMVAVTVSHPIAISRAAPFITQRGDGLDTPLMAANMCGTGDPKDTHFTLAATGDTFPHENIQAVGEAQGYDYLFDHVRPFLKAADLAYTNFDGAMLDSSPYSGYPAFNYNPALATALKNTGIGLVSTANNHIMDRGPEGLDATMQVLTKAGILYHGTVTSTVGSLPRPIYLPLTFTRNGVSIKAAFLSFSWGTNGIADPFNQVNLLWNTNDYAQQGGLRKGVLDAIAQARRETDLVIVAAHWGYEYQFYPEQNQVSAAAQMAAAGADIILGAQPHTLQPVDIIDTAGHKTLVIYSLANFLASQGAFQDASFSATSVIFYVDITRQADGKVRVGGYRYLPTIHVDNDTRPAPIPPQGYENVIAHVRQEMRDFDGARQLNLDPAALNGRVEVCPSSSFDGTADAPLAGDFAQYVTTLGSGTTPHAPQESLAIFGRPIRPVVQELSGDCAHPVSVLYTERQRLELHPEVNWPGRVVGTQVGTAVYSKVYGASQVQRRQNLEGDAITNDRFKTFFRTYGGLGVFGYPISGELHETDPETGHQRTVQYFERARFELADTTSADASPLAGVQLGLLSREYPGIDSACHPAQTASSSGPQKSRLASTLVRRPALGFPAWRVWAIVVVSVALLAAVGLWEAERRHRARYALRRAARARRPRELEE